MNPRVVNTPYQQNANYVQKTVQYAPTIVLPTKYITDTTSNYPYQANPYSTTTHSKQLTNNPYQTNTSPVYYNYQQNNNINNYIYKYSGEIERTTYNNAPSIKLEENYGLINQNNLQNLNVHKRPSAGMVQNYKYMNVNINTRNIIPDNNIYYKEKKIKYIQPQQNNATNIDNVNNYHQNYNNININNNAKYIYNEGNNRKYNYEYTDNSMYIVQIGNNKTNAPPIINQPISQKMMPNTKQIIAQNYNNQNMKHNPINNINNYIYTNQPQYQQPQKQMIPPNNTKHIIPNQHIPSHQNKQIQNNNIINNQVNMNNIKTINNQINNINNIPKQKNIIQQNQVNHINNKIHNPNQNINQNIVGYQQQKVIQPQLKNAAPQPQIINNKHPSIEEPPDNIRKRGKYQNENEYFNNTMPNLRTYYDVSTGYNNIIPPENHKIIDKNNFYIQPSAGISFNVNKKKEKYNMVNVPQKINELSFINTKRSSDTMKVNPNIINNQNNIQIQKNNMIQIQKNANIKDNNINIQNNIVQVQKNNHINNNINNQNNIQLQNNNNINDQNNIQLQNNNNIINQHNRQLQNNINIINQHNIQMQNNNNITNNQSNVQTQKNKSNNINNIKQEFVEYIDQYGNILVMINGKLIDKRLLINNNTNNNRQNHEKLAYQKINPKDVNLPQNNTNIIQENNQFSNTYPLPGQKVYSTQALINDNMDPNMNANMNISNNNYQNQKYSQRSNRFLEEQNYTNINNYNINLNVNQQDALLNDINNTFKKANSGQVTQPEILTVEPQKPKRRRPVFKIPPSKKRSISQGRSLAFIHKYYDENFILEEDNEDNASDSENKKTKKTFKNVVKEVINIRKLIPHHNNEEKENDFSKQSSGNIMINEEEMHKNENNKENEENNENENNNVMRLSHIGFSLERSSFIPENENNKDENNNNNETNNNNFDFDGINIDKNIYEEKKIDLDEIDKKIKRNIDMNLDDDKDDDNLNIDKIDEELNKKLKIYTEKEKQKSDKLENNYNTEQRNNNNNQKLSGEISNQNIYNNSLEEENKYKNSKSDDIQKEQKITSKDEFNTNEKNPSYINNGNIINNSSLMSQNLLRESDISNINPKFCEPMEDSIMNMQINDSNNDNDEEKRINMDIKGHDLDKYFSKDDEKNEIKKKEIDSSLKTISSEDEKRNSQQIVDNLEDEENKNNNNLKKKESSDNKVNKEKITTINDIISGKNFT